VTVEVPNDFLYPLNGKRLYNRPEATYWQFGVAFLLLQSQSCGVLVSPHSDLSDAACSEINLMVLLQVIGLSHLL